MLAVEILINGKVIVRKTARNIGRTKDKPSTAWRLYETDTGEIIRHNRKHGAELLAIQLLTAPNKLKKG